MTRLLAALLLVAALPAATLGQEREPAIRMAQVEAPPEQGTLSLSLPETPLELVVSRLGLRLEGEWKGVVAFAVVETLFDPVWKDPPLESIALLPDEPERVRAVFVTPDQPRRLDLGVELPLGRR